MLRSFSPSVLDDLVIKRPTENYLHQFQQQQHGEHARTRIDHVCGLDIDRAPFVRETTLVCTLGDSWNSPEKIEEMIEGGMNILRLNMSMGSKENYANVIKLVREIEKKHNYNPSVGIALDLSAPPVRTGLVNGDLDAAVVLKSGQMIKLTINDELKDKTSNELIWIDSQYFPTLIHCVSPGDRIYLDEGVISFIVKDVGLDSINCLVENGGEFGSYQRVQLPFERMYQRTFDTSYMSDLKFALDTKVDYVFTGYCLNVNQVAQAKRVLGQNILLFSKIETLNALRNIDEIMLYADGIIIGRGNLGLCFPTEKVFQIQKQIIAKCNIFNKPVFVITQLLESMRFKPRATRAEISDVANAVIDGADGLILTVETSRGLFPKESLRVLHKTCREAESAIFHQKFWFDLKMSRDSRGLSIMEPSYIAALAAVEAACTSSASAIYVVTTSGRSALLIASFRPFCPVVAIMRHPEVARKCHSIRGIHPFVYLAEKLPEWSKDMDARLNAAIEFTKSRGFVSDGDQIVIVTGWLPGSGSTNTVRVLQLPEDSKTLTIINSQSNLTENDWFD